MCNGGRDCSGFYRLESQCRINQYHYHYGYILALSLFIQFRGKSYVPSIYWISVVLLSIFGTLITDNLTDIFEVPLETTTIVFSIALAVIFAAWYKTEKTLSIHSIYTTRREAFYWLAIFFTFALGTAVGDLVAETFEPGYLVTAAIFGAALAVIAIAYFKLSLISVLAFWLAYILTRPLGASIGDYLAQSPDSGGLGLGTLGNQCNISHSYFSSSYLSDFHQKRRPPNGKCYGREREQGEEERSRR